MLELIPQEKTNRSPPCEVFFDYTHDQIFIKYKHSCCVEKLEKEGVGRIDGLLTAFTCPFLRMEVHISSQNEVRMEIFMQYVYNCGRFKIKLYQREKMSLLPIGIGVRKRALNCRYLF